MAVVINGKEVAEKVKAGAAAAVAGLKDKGIVPCLAVILVGEDPASVSYVTGKRKALAAAGMEDKSVLLPADTSEEELLAVIRRLNEDKSVHGILVQLPLPPQIDTLRVTEAISPEKDVDGFHSANIGHLFSGTEGFLPCTPHGICVMLKEAGIKTDGANVVIVGRSAIVGKPLALLLLRKEYNATVTVCHRGTKNLAEMTRQADILVVASGHAGTVTKDMVKPGAAVIDVGVNRIPDSSKKSGFRLVGDADYEGVSEVAGYITPVPGGVGPMTIAMLIYNTLEAARRQNGLC
ncbi:MAG: bifunctional 5,10-methylene-tetrahydrofolate dehydrogenase/5,10-methylene-tetrahydrofolate cyclohydrolase [Treponema sp.]|nr:bifunctional 5,10-methylene-tetrahydrofolate dehydrogenase/5,10-methylene-tetrahydrofolate cyclohydrolase [Treponema sp.]